MASLPESSTFDAGVYQLELTDPVIGGPSGVSNTPLKNLANRTRYLKDHVDALETSRAPLANPAFTGVPTAPTAAQGTSNTQLATTAFVNAEIAADMAANLATAAPLVNGAAAVGTSAKMAREDHVHPTDTTRAPLASPAFTGTPTAPTPSTGDNSTKLATTAFVQTEITGTNVPSGTVIFAARTTAPTGYLKANGAAVSRTIYAALFAAIGTTFGAGDGSTTFNLPDLRGEFPRGWDDGRGTDPGRSMGSWQKGSLFAYDTQNDYIWTTTTTLNGGAGSQVAVGVDPFNTADFPDVLISGGSRSGSYPLPGQDGGMTYSGTTRPRNVALLACIKF